MHANDTPLIRDLDAKAVLWLTLNRISVRNALDETLMAALTEAFKQAAQDDSVRCIVLQGAGKVFCAGGDLNWMRRMAGASQAVNEADAEILARLFKTIRSCPKPVITRVHGAVYGGGLGLVAASDICITQKETRFCFSEVKLGLAPAIIMPFILEKMALPAARHLMLTAEVFSAEKAVQAGLAQILAEDEPDAQAKLDTVLSQLGANGAGGMAATKALLYQLHYNPAQTQPDTLEAILTLCVKTLAQRRVSDEAQGRIAKFLAATP